MEFGISKFEVFLRVCSVLILGLTACLVGFDSQSKEIFYIRRRASFSDLNALLNMVYVDSVAAGYNLFQLICKCYVSPNWFKEISKSNYVFLSWVCFLLDQIAVYITFATNTAALQEALLAVIGERSLQWMKLCNKYTRFCVQIGGALLCGYAVSLLMAIIASFSAFNLFRLYSPQHFMVLKPTT